MRKQSLQSDRRLNLALGIVLNSRKQMTSPLPGFHAEIPSRWQPCSCLHANAESAGDIKQIVAGYIPSPVGGTTAMRRRRSYRMRELLP